MSVYMVCERAIGIIRGKSLKGLSASEKSMLEVLNYEGLVASGAREEAVAAVRSFEGVRDRMLEADPWVFARKDAVLAPLVATLAGWRFNYALPNDCIRPLGLIVDVGGTKYPATASKWETAGRVVGSDYAAVSLRYTARITDTRLWSELFEEAFCYSLAVEMAAGVTGLMEVQNQAARMAQATVQKARDCGAVKHVGERPFDIEHVGSYTRRYGGCAVGGRYGEWR